MVQVIVLCLFRMSFVLLRFRRTGFYYREVLEILHDRHVVGSGEYAGGAYCGVDYFVQHWHDSIFVFPLSADVTMMMMMIMMMMMMLMTMMMLMMMVIFSSGNTFFGCRSQTQTSRCRWSKSCKALGYPGNCARIWLVAPAASRGGELSAVSKMPVNLVCKLVVLLIC